MHKQGESSRSGGPVHDIGLASTFSSVRTVKSTGGGVLRKPVKFRKRWEDYFKELLDKKYHRQEAEEGKAAKEPIPRTQKEFGHAIMKVKIRKAIK